LHWCYSLSMEPLHAVKWWSSSDFLPPCDDLHRSWFGIHDQHHPKWHVFPMVVATPGLWGLSDAVDRIQGLDHVFYVSFRVLLEISKPHVVISFFFRGLNVILYRPLD
jgi:hypothetical protein